MLTLFFSHDCIISFRHGCTNNSKLCYYINNCSTCDYYVIEHRYTAGATVPLVIALSAHFFVFYFGIIADITPPVALAAFAASGISGGDPIKTGYAFGEIAIAAFIIPYMIVFTPAMLNDRFSIPEFLWVVFTAIIGMIAIGAGMIGYWYRKCNVGRKNNCNRRGITINISRKLFSIAGLIIFVILLVINDKRKEKYGSFSTLGNYQININVKNTS